MDDIQYTQYYVAFLDILGFKNLVSDPACSCEGIMSIYELAQNKHQIFFKDESENVRNSIKMKIMSDSICLYIRTDFPNALHYLLVYCVSFQYDLFITKNLLMRGGITSGDMYAKGDIIFGPALTEAYLLEEKNAKVPRIIIRKKTIDEGISGMDENMLTPTRQCVFRDDDAFYALNYFQFFILEKYNEALDQAKATISNHLDTTIDESIRQKYLYVERNIKKWIKENDDA